VAQPAEYGPVAALITPERSRARIDRCLKFEELWPLHRRWFPIELRPVAQHRHFDNLDELAVRSARAHFVPISIPTIIGLPSEKYAGPAFEPCRGRGQLPLMNYARLPCLPSCGTSNKSPAGHLNSSKRERQNRAWGLTHPPGWRPGDEPGFLFASASQAAPGTERSAPASARTSAAFWAASDKALHPQNPVPGLVTSLLPRAVTSKLHT
jgi:hypothetical protein